MVWNYQCWGDVLRNTWRLLISAMIVIALASILGCNTRKARSEMKDGLRAYQSGEYPQASRHFETASVLDPKLLDAQVALAATATKRYLEFVPTPETAHFAEEAVSRFKHVLDSNPSRDQQILCFKGLSTLYVKMAKFNDAYDYNRKLIEVAPDIPESYYAIGVIEWTQTHNFRMSSVGLVHHSEDEFTTDTTACEKLRNANAPKVQIAIAALQRAISLRPEDEGTMAYLNLMYREKAHIDCTDNRERENDLRTADEWIDKTMRLNAVNENRLKAVHELTLPTGNY
jgi:tetratricopeptide (TPR) repeat protein